MEIGSVAMAEPVWEAYRMSSLHWRTFALGVFLVGVTAWLARNPRIPLHFTATSGSWLNMVEIFFGIITRQAIRRGGFTSVRDLTDAIRAFIDGWNERCQLFTWTKTADEILPHATGSQRISITRHWGRDRTKVTGDSPVGLYRKVA